MLCPRLVAWREQVSREKVKRYAELPYWGRPVPPLGDLSARLVLVGLAPGAHGANRTGRMFTGDRSGDWLYRALHRAGFANQPQSIDREDGLRLIDCFITNAARCVPPDNKPLPEELARCRPFLMREIHALTRMRVVLGLGKIGFDTAFGALLDAQRIDPQKRPKFAHGARAELGRGITLLGSFHPSQQNTFTGKLTEPMFDAIFSSAREIIEESAS
jgi:uracil-DNA glycosylase family 4